MVNIIPAILATDETTYKQKLDRIVESQLFNEGWVQIDLMDGKFVDNRSVGVEVISRYPTALKLEAQLMVEDPGVWIDDLGKTPVKRIVFPIEGKEAVQGWIDTIKQYGLEAGLSANPQTAVKKLEPFVDTIDVVLVMSVHPGFGGQEFLPETIDKVTELARMRQKMGLNFLIEVDGGINDFVVKDLVRSGADNLVIGSHLIEGDIDENLEKIWEAIKS